MKKRNFYLHIGMHKCASKFLQSEIFKKEKIKLEDCIIFTPKNNSARFDDIIKNIVENKISLKKAHLIIKKIIKKNKNIIISNENLLGNHFNNFKNKDKIFSIMEHLFDKPKYLIVYRNQSEFLFSLWKHRIRKKLLNKSFYKFINDKNFEKNNLHKISSQYLINYKILDYNKIFNKYIYVAKQRAFFLNLEILKSQNKKIFTSKITKFLGLKKSNFNLNLKKKINYSTKYELIYFFANQKIFIINKFLIITLSYLNLLFLSLKIVNKKLFKQYKIFNFFSLLYFDLVEKIFFRNKGSGEKFLDEIKNQKKIIKKYYKLNNVNFEKKILNCNN